MGGIGCSIPFSFLVHLVPANNLSAPNRISRYTALHVEIWVLENLNHVPVRTRSSSSHSSTYLHESDLQHRAAPGSLCKIGCRSHTLAWLPRSSSSARQDTDFSSSCRLRCGFWIDLGNGQRVVGVKFPDRISKNVTIHPLVEYSLELNLRAHSKWCWERYVWPSLPHTA